MNNVPVPLEGTDHLATHGIADRDRLAAVGRRETPAIGAEHDTPNRAGGDTESGDFSAGRGVANDYRAVFAGGGEALAVWAKDRAGDRPVVAFEGANFRTGRNDPGIHQRREHRLGRAEGQNRVW